MNLSQAHSDCPVQLLQEFLAGETSDAESAELERHLDSCQLCRDRIERSAADPESWNRASQYLNTKADPPAITLAIESLLDGPMSFFLTDEQSDQVSLKTIEDYLSRWLAPAGPDGKLGRLGEYEITDIIGLGGMGLVLKANDETLDRSVAIKTLSHLVADSSKARRDFHREATLAASLRHPNLIQVHSVNTWQGVPYLVMPLYRMTLHEFCRNRHLTLKQILSISLQIASGLDSAHKQGLIHRDIKPSNILLDDEAVVSGDHADLISSLVISDFGLARVSDNGAKTLTNGLAGTPQFMSPEQARGQRLDERSDIFSFGSLVYWLATGQSPFESENSYGTIRSIIEEDHANASSLRQDLPDWFDKLLDGMLNKDRESRTRPASTIVADLQQCLAYCDAPDRTSLPESLLQSTPKRTLTANLLLAGLLILVPAAFWLVNRENQPVQPSKHESQTTAETRNESGFANLRMGPLDSLDVLSAKEDFRTQTRLKYWLTRLVNLPVDQIPASLLSQIETIAKSDNAEARELATKVLAKNPFQEVIPNENPFQEVDDPKRNIGE